MRRKGHRRGCRAEPGTLRTRHAAAARAPGTNAGRSRTVRRASTPSSSRCHKPQYPRDDLDSEPSTRGGRSRHVNHGTEMPRSGCRYIVLPV